MLDEQVPVELAGILNALAPQHTIRTVADEGWKGVKNGELLRRVREAGFGALVTVDRRMEYQQNIKRSGLGVVVLHARRARIQELAPLAPAIARALDAVQPGEVVRLRPEGPNLRMKWTVGRAYFRRAWQARWHPTRVGSCCSAHCQ